MQSPAQKWPNPDELGSAPTRRDRCVLRQTLKVSRPVAKLPAQTQHFQVIRNCVKKAMVLRHQSLRSAELIPVVQETEAAAKAQHGHCQTLKVTGPFERIHRLRQQSQVVPNCARTSNCPIDLHRMPKERSPNTRMTSRTSNCRRMQIQESTTQKPIEQSCGSTVLIQGQHYRRLTPKSSIVHRLKPLGPVKPSFGETKGSPGLQRITLTQENLIWQSFVATAKGS